jgi:hypothetical protein
MYVITGAAEGAAVGPEGAALGDIVGNLVSATPAALIDCMWRCRCSRGSAKEGLVVRDRDCRGIKCAGNSSDSLEQ